MKRKKEESFIWIFEIIFGAMSISDTTLCTHMGLYYTELKMMQ